MPIDISSFLTEGRQIPAGSALQATQSETILPEWYSNYAMQMLSNQQAQMAQPYQTYQGPRVAQFSPTQQQSFGMTGQAATAYQPALGAATGATQGLMGQNALGAAQPYFNQATATSGFNAAQPSLTQAGQYTQQSTQNFGQQAASPYFGAAGQLSGVNAALPAYQQAQGNIQQGMNAGGLNAAQPYLSQAGGQATDVSAYMNPYISQVVNRAGEMGARTLREQLMPEIESRYVRAGQLGFGPRGGAAGTPSGMMTDTARALRDVDENVRAQQANLLSQGYTQAQGAAQADMARQAQLAGTAGGLGSQQQQALLEAAQQQAAMGSQLGQLTGQQQQNLTALGSQAGQLGTAQQQALAQAGQQMGALGQISGNLTQQQQEMLANLGIQTGNLAGSDINRQLSAAQQLAQMGGLAQQYGLAGAGALGGVGATEQTQAQKNLDIAYGDFLRQQGYNQEQINNAMATFKGVAGAVPTVTQQYGIAPTGQAAEYKPSTASTVAGALTGGAALLKELGGLGLNL